MNLRFKDTNYSDRIAYNRNGHIDTLSSEMKNSVVPLNDIKEKPVVPIPAWYQPKTIKQTLKPILYCLKFTGLLHTVSVSQEPDVGVSQPQRCFSIYKVYAIFVLLLLWYNFGFSLVSFQDATQFNGVVCNEIITSTWFLQVAGVSVSNFAKCKLWDNLFKLWDEMANEMNLNTEKTIRRSAVVATVLYGFWLLCAFSFTAVGTILNPTLQSPIPGTGIVVAIIFRILFIITYFYFVTTWYLTTSVFAVMAVGIFKAYKHFDVKLKEAFVGNGRFDGDIEHFRLQHDKLTRFLGVADDMFSVYIFFTIGTIIPLIIVTLYFVVFQSIDTFSYVATWWSVSLSMIQLMVVFVGGGAINHMAHAPVGFLYSVDLRNFKEKECSQMAVFLNQLTSIPIGFTAVGLFTIDKPTIITFAGSIATYAVVVIQFKP